MHTITLSGRTVPYSLVRSRRNRYVRLTVMLGKGLRVSAPIRFPERDIPRIIRERADWVLAKLDEFEKLERHTPKARYRSGAETPFLGKNLKLKVLPACNGRAEVRRRDGCLEIELPGHESGADREDALRSVLSAWYRIQARKILLPRVRYYAALMRVSPTSVSIRRQRSRWGSCTAQGALNLNQCLAMLPPRMMDYVVVHELAHLIELNHSESFWNIVARYCSNRRVCQAWLKEHTYLLDR